MSGKILSLAAMITLITALDVAIEKPEVEFFDKEYYKDMRFSVRRLNRNGPYVILGEIYFLKTLGNNVTVSLQIFENLSGRYQPTLIATKYQLCDFFENEPYLGQMLAKQFSSNASCPYAPGLLRFPPLEVRLDKFPYFLPFTWPFKTIRTRCDLTFIVTKTQHPIAKINFYAKVIQNSGKKSNKTTVL